MGLNHKQSGREILLDKDIYIQALLEIIIDIEHRKQLGEPFVDQEKEQLHSVCVNLLWTKLKSRSDKTYISCKASKATSFFISWFTDFYLKSNVRGENKKKRKRKFCFNNFFSRFKISDARG